MPRLLERAGQAALAVHPARRRGRRARAPGRPCRAEAAHVTRFWGGGPDIGARVLITALSANGALIRELRVEIPADFPIRVQLPDGAAVVTLQRTTEDPRVRVALGRRRPRRQGRRQGRW
jgi:hypothetical protein